MKTVKRPLGDVRLHVATSHPSARLARRRFLRLGATDVSSAASADVVFEDEQAGSPEGVGERVVCVFQDHRAFSAGLIASETTAQAGLGLMDYLPPWGGQPERTGPSLAVYTAAALASAVAMAYLYRGMRDGKGVRFGVSPLRALSTLRTLTWAARSGPDEWIGAHVRQRERQVDSGYATLNGRITLDFPVNRYDGWRVFVAELGLDEAQVEAWGDRWSATMGWGDLVDAARPVYQKVFSRMTTAAAIEMIRRHGGLSVPYMSVKKCLEHPQAQAVGLSESLSEGAPWRLQCEDTIGPIAFEDRSHERISALDARPLSGLRILDLGVGGVGPFAAVIAGWLGAEVIRIEPPFDFAHTLLPKKDGISVVYLACNRGKHAVPLDFKNDEQRASAQGLAAQADVINENFRRGVLDRLGLGFRQIADGNPRVVYCSTNGYGWAGPMADEPCTDPHIQAFAGFSVANAQRSEGPPRSLRYYGGIDLVTSCIAAEAMMAGLFTHAQTGYPVRVETSMLHAVSDLVKAGDELPLYAPDGVFRTKDGYLAITCRDDEEWSRIVEALGRPESLLDSSFQHFDGRLAAAEALTSRLNDHFATEAAHGWAQRLSKYSIPSLRVLRDDEAMARKDFWEWRLFDSVEYGGQEPIVLSGPPVSGVDEMQLGFAPRPPTNPEDAMRLLGEGARWPGAQPWTEATSDENGDI